MTRTWAPIVACLALACFPSAATAGEEAPRWALDEGALAVYDRYPVTVDDAGVRTRGKPEPHGAFGHRLVDGRFPLPLFPALADLGPAFALAFPPEERGGKERTLVEDPRDAGPVSLTGRWTVEDGDGPLRTATATLDLRHRGPAKSDAFTRKVIDGTVALRVVFDAAAGRVVEGSWDLVARLIPDEAKGADRKLTTLESHGDLVLRGVRTRNDDDFQASVDTAIDRGMAFLAKEWKKDDTPRAWGGYPGGLPALVALTQYACDPMRAAGDAALAAAMAEAPTKTYQTAVTMMAIEMKRTPPGEAALLRSGRIDKPLRNLTDDERAWMEKGAAFLLEHAAGPGKWHYPSKPAGGRFLPPKPDLSNSQYAVLGLLAAHRCHVATDDNDWLGILRAFLQAQSRDGDRVPGDLVPHGHVAAPEEEVSSARAPLIEARGFPYCTGDAHCSATMTCAGIGSIAIARGVLIEMESARFTPDLRRAAETAIADGFGWIHSHWTVEQAAHGNRRPKPWLHYGLYALERAGLLADVESVNGHHWYGDGALHLVLTQDDAGWWSQRPQHAHHKLADTCFALLFLKRAVTPVTSGR